MEGIKIKKKIISLSLVSVFIISALSAVGTYMDLKSTSFDDVNSIESFIIRISFPDFEIVKNNGTHSIEIDGYNYLLEAGKPLLPFKNILFALPPDSIVESVDVKGLNMKQIPGFYDIIPVSKVMPSCHIVSHEEYFEEIDKKWDENYKLTYNSDDGYPATVGELVNKGSFHTIRYISVFVYPFVYHPASGRLFKYDSAEIKVNYQNDNSGFLRYDSDIDKQASELFFNYRNIKELYNSSMVSSSSSLDNYNYVILSSSYLYDSIISSNFIDWKSNLGFNIKIVNITDSIIANQPGIDLAEQIRNFLRNNYVEWGVEYLLIIGNYDNIPMRYCYPNSYNHDFNLADVYGGELPTDYYYADLSYPDSDSWDSDGDGFYGEFRDDNPDFSAEVFVGRIPTNDQNRVIYTLDKLVTFESDTGDWKNNVLDAGAIAFFKPYKDGAEIIDYIEKDLMSGIPISHYSEQEGVRVSDCTWEPLNEKAFTGDWKTGKYGIVNADAHGWPHAISRLIWVSDDDGDNRPDDEELEWKYFISVNSDLDDDYPSIFFDMSCLIGYPEPSPDSWPDGWRGNLGIDLLTKPGWGTSAGVLSATRLAYGGSTNWPNPPGGMESICYEFNKNIIEKDQPIGEALYNSKFYTTINCPLGGYPEYINLFGYNLYGDPSLNREGVALQDRPEKPSTPSGPTSGQIGNTYFYSTSTNDPNGDRIYYWFDWDDGNNTGWLGPYDSGEECEANHCWNKKANYEIRVRVKDVNGYVSEWSDPFKISMPKYRKIQNFLVSFIKKYSHFKKSDNIYKTDYILNPCYFYEKQLHQYDSVVLTPDDPLYKFQWSLENTGQSGGIEDVDIDAPEAWEITIGDADITIAIIDSGIDFNHPDLIDNIWINNDEIEGNGLDDDSNGYIDDVNGYDFTNTDNDTIPFDRNGHGTLLAGRITPVTDNHIGLAGITWNSIIMPLKVLDTSWKASVKDVIEAIHYAADNNADIICMTFEGTTFDQGFQNAINYAYEKGVFICAAAGNSGTSKKRYPAGYENVTSVAAINQWNSRMEYTYEEVDISIASNYGSWVDVAAPGQEIYSTMPTYHVALNDFYMLDENYTMATGCCVTAPLVAGVAALLLSHNPTLSPNELTFIIRASTEPVNSSYDLGTGCINAYNALVYNNKPETPNGPRTGNIEEEYTYSTSIHYANNEPLYYLWDFGDGIKNDWIGPINSNEPCEISYSWDEEGEYTIKVKVKDGFGGESEWSDSLQVCMPKNKLMNSGFFELIKNHRILFPFLRLFLNLKGVI